MEIITPVALGRMRLDQCLKIPHTGLLLGQNADTFDLLDSPNAGHHEELKVRTDRLQSDNDREAFMLVF